MFVNSFVHSSNRHGVSFLKTKLIAKDIVSITSKTNSNIITTSRPISSLSSLSSSPFSSTKISRIIRHDYFRGGATSIFLNYKNDRGGDDHANLFSSLVILGSVVASSTSSYALCEDNNNSSSSSGKGSKWNVFRWFSSSKKNKEKEENEKKKQTELLATVEKEKEEREEKEKEIQGHDNNNSNPYNLPPFLDEISKEIGDKVQEGINTGVPTQLSYGFICGYCSGFTVKRIGKVVGFVFGLGFIGLQSLQHYGYIQIDHNQLKKDVEKVLDRNNDGIVDKDDLTIVSNEVIDILSTNIPSGSGFMAGFVGGIRS